MVDNLKEKITEAEIEIKDLEERLRDAKRSLNDLQVQQAYEMYGVKVGSRVFDSRGIEYEVSGFNRFYSDNEPSIRGYKIKKNGEPSLNEQYVGSGWTLKENRNE